MLLQVLMTKRSLNNWWQDLIDWLILNGTYLLAYYYVSAFVNTKPDPTHMSDLGLARLLEKAAPTNKRVVESPKRRSIIDEFVRYKRTDHWLAKKAW